MRRCRPSGPQPRNRDYRQDGQMGTSLISNIRPQKPNLNRKVWEKREEIEADDHANRFEEIWVIDGLVFPDGDAEELRGGVHCHGA